MTDGVGFAVFALSAGVVHVLDMFLAYGVNPALSRQSAGCCCCCLCWC